MGTAVPASSADCILDLPLFVDTSHLRGRENKRMREAGFTLTAFFYFAFLDLTGFRVDSIIPLPGRKCDSPKIREILKVKCTKPGKILKNKHGEN